MVGRAVGHYGCWLRLTVRRLHAQAFLIAGIIILSIGNDSAPASAITVGFRVGLR